MNVNRRPAKPLSLMDRACYNGGQTYQSNGPTRLIADADPSHS